jgi:CRISPR/Cas system-associated endoribonuclease Cas2
MMMKKLLALVIFCLWFVGVQAQEQTQAQVQAKEDKLTRLMSEREQLILEYQYYNQQNSNFWGKQSKKDLLNIINTLKEIIKKDSELIAAVKEASVRKIAESTVENQRAGKQILQDERLINSQIADLQGQIKTLQSQAKKRERVILDLKEQLKATDEVRYGKDRVIAILGGAAFLLFLYAVFLQVRLSRKPAKKRKKA